MISNETIFVSGAGGFIGGHLIKKLLENNNKIIAADIKPVEYWFQTFDEVINYDSLDLMDMNNCKTIFENNKIDYVFNMACNMGGMGFIENNKADCMLSVLINTNLLIVCKDFQIKKYFFSSSACAYNKDLQKETGISGLKETDAYPANPEDGYGWEKLFSERMCRHFYEDFGLETRVARFHNIYGPVGTFDGGREKAPAALCRKVIEANINDSNEIEVWGDGKQTRTFLFIEDCIEGVLRLFDSDFREPLNIGSNEQVSINQMIEIIEKISNSKKLNKNYLLDKPKGVRGRSSNNELATKTLDWNYSINLEEGLKKTYEWIFLQITRNKDNSKKFTRS